MEINKEIKKLHDVLKKHPDVQDVFRQPVREEINIKRFVVEKHRRDNYKRIIDSIVQNLQMLENLEIDIEDENVGTRKTIDAAHNLMMLFKTQNPYSVVHFDSEEEENTFINTAAMLVLFCVSSQITRKVSKLVDLDLNLKKGLGDRVIYRGHSNAKYKLIPSIYRNISIDNGFGIVTYSKLKDLYSESKLINKYERVFGSGIVDYQFCAFAQHSKAYSPLLDFTDDIKVALSFAVSKTDSVNDYIKNEAALFSLSYRHDINEIDSIKLDTIDVFISEKKVSPYSKIRNKEVFCCTYKDFDVEAFVVKDKTNDRMKYQKGCFLYFQRAVIINGNLLMPINYGRKCKYTIPSFGDTLTKQRIYEKIRDKYSYYLQEYLMNPYKYFEEAPL